MLVHNVVLYNVGLPVVEIAVGAMVPQANGKLDLRYFVDNLINCGSPITHIGFVI